MIKGIRVVFHRLIHPPAGKERGPAGLVRPCALVRFLAQMQTVPHPPPLQPGLYNLRIANTNNYGN
jgi:hypothetical protein